MVNALQNGLLRPRGENACVTRGSVALALALTLLLAGFAQRSAEPASITVRDSAGVRIVESRIPVASDDTWAVESSPILHNGQTGGSPECQLFKVGPFARLSDGTMVVAFRSEVRFFTGNGL